LWPLVPSFLIAAGYEDDDFDADSMNEIDVGEEEDAEEEISMRM